MSAGCSIAILIFCRFKNYRAVLLLLIGMMVGGSFYGSRVIFPAAKSPYVSSVDVGGNQVADSTGRQIGDLLGIGVDPYNYYTGIVPIPMIHTEAALLDFVGSSERVFCLLRFE